MLPFVRYAHLLASIRFAATGWSLCGIPSRQRAVSSTPLFVSEVESVEIPDDVDLDLAWFEEDLEEQGKEPTIPNATLKTLFSPPENCQLGPPSSSRHVIGQWFDVVALAYIGDAVLELYVRSRKVNPTTPTVEARRQVYSLVRKENQSNLIDKLEATFLLQEAELVLVETARNHGPAVTLEALIGYTHIADKRRYQELMSWLDVYMEHVEADNLRVQKSSLETLLFPRPDCDADDLSSSALAFIGDAFFELFVRFQKIWPPRSFSTRLYDVASLVRPLHQSKLLEKVLESFPLTETETSIIEKALASAPDTEHLTRSKDTEMFAAAGALEALIGYTYMKDKNRCQKLMNWIEVHLERVETIPTSVPNRPLQALLLPPPDCPLGPPSWVSVSDPTSFDTTSWMLIGDAVQELLLRCRSVLRTGKDVRKRHGTASPTQEHQLKLFLKLQETFPLTKLEMALVEKAQRSVVPKKKNTKSAKGRKGYTKNAHAASTALKALIGFAYISDETRCQQLLNWLAFFFRRVDDEFVMRGPPDTPLRRLLVPKCEAYDLSPASLAYIGDAVYGLFVRCHVLWPHRSVGDRMNTVNHFVCAEHQSLLMEKLRETFDLTDIESTVVKEARGAGHATRGLHPKVCADSSAFEALIGYTYIDDQERCKDLLNWIAFHLERV